MEKLEIGLSSFKEWLENKLQQEIDLLPENDPAQIRIKNAINYSLLGNAKRVRAFLIEQSCNHFNISRKSVKNLLIAIELIHCYSLIHDDLPCMDNADMRRGKPSVHKKFDEETALLTGNSLMNLAFDYIFSDNFEFENYIKIQVAKHLSRAIGYHGMMAGQMFDMLINDSSTTEEFIHMNKLKTGALFAFCMSSGAILSQSAKVHEYQQLGYDIGYIFQLVDDIIDVDDENGKRFINHIGGQQAARQHLAMIETQTIMRAEKLCTNTLVPELIKYITNQLK